jgi:hypothetical protein
MPEDFHCRTAEEYRGLSDMLLKILERFRALAR